MAEQIYKNLRIVHERSIHYFKHYFIPHDNNNYRPKVLHPNLLRTYSVLLILVKVFVTGFLFLSYPTYGEFAAFTSGQIIELTNVERQNQGLGSLTSNSLLAQAATQKAQDMLAKGYFDHTGPDGTRPWDWISGVGYGYLYAGENLAKDFTSASSTVAALMNSASHRKNILNENYKEIGVAVADGTINGKQTVVMVQFFGAQAVPTPAPVVTNTTPEPEPAVPEPKPQPIPTPTPEPTPTPQPAPTPAPIPVPEPEVYAAELVNQSDDTIQLASGVSTTIWAEFKNVGNVTWKNYGPHFIAINLTNPAGRNSVFQHENWIEDYRPMIMETSEVTPGSTEKFEFSVTAPDEAGNFEESFGLVAENLTWIDGGVFTVPVIVSTPQEVKPAETTAPAAEPKTTEPDQTKIITIKDDPEVSTSITPTTQGYSSQLNLEQNTGVEKNIVYYSQIFFLILLIFLIVSLLINILVNIRIQHFPTIFRTLLVILLAALVYFTRIHFVEALGGYLNII